MTGSTVQVVFHPGLVLDILAARHVLAPFIPVLTAAEVDDGVEIRVLRAGQVEYPVEFETAEIVVRMDIGIEHLKGPAGQEDVALGSGGKPALRVPTVDELVPVDSNAEPVCLHQDISHLSFQSLIGHPLFVVVSAVMCQRRCPDCEAASQKLRGVEVLLGFSLKAGRSKDFPPPSENIFDGAVERASAVRTGVVSSFIGRSIIRRVVSEVAEQAKASAALWEPGFDTFGVEWFLAVALAPHQVLVGTARQKAHRAVSSFGHRRCTRERVHFVLLALFLSFV